MLLAFGCKPDIKETGAALSYFDLKAFLKADTAKLSNLNKPVFKTVNHNGVIESKKLMIADWGRELSLFTESDINRPAWKYSYTVINNDEFLIYKARYPELKMRQMMIRKVKNQIKWIVIYNRTKNALYQTSEKLTYYPDSLYLIEKRQQVRLMGINRYAIKGMIK